LREYDIQAFLTSRNTVDFPLPDAPTNATVCPGATAKETSFTWRLVKNARRIVRAEAACVSTFIVVSKGKAKNSRDLIKSKAQEEDDEGMYLPNLHA
jgi:hypothetical protein